MKDMSHKSQPWSFTSAEYITAVVFIISTVVLVLLWLTNTFRTKEEAKENRAYLERRIDSVEAQNTRIIESLIGISKDVSWIKGKLEQMDAKDRERER